MSGGLFTVDSLGRKPSPRSIFIALLSRFVSPFMWHTISVLEGLKSGKRDIVPLCHCVLPPSLSEPPITVSKNTQFN